MSEVAQITVNPDQHAVALKAIRDMGGALSTIASMLQNGNTLDAELTGNVMFVSEHYLADLGKALGVQTEGAAQIEQRNAMTRAAHQRVRELEAQLGNTVTPEVAQQQLKNLHQHINKWWDLEGFGHISEVHFGPYGCEVDFSCHLFGSFSRIDSETPVTDKERKKTWHEELVDRGFVLNHQDREPSLVDCDATRKVLMDLISHRLPSAQVTGFKNHVIRGTELFALNGVKAYIRNIGDIVALPVPVEAPTEGNA